VLLSEPLKDWDLADFPDTGSANIVGSIRLHAEDVSHLRNVIQAYRLTASAVAPLRMGRVLDDKARRRGWADAPLPRNPTVRRNLP